MELLAPDIVDFVENRFSLKHRQRVAEILDRTEITTPRVVRAVLYLSDGSISLLEHYAAECQLDVRRILSRAEYLTGVSVEPLFVRDMSLPFTHERNLGLQPLRATVSTVSMESTVSRSRREQEIVVAEPGRVRQPRRAGRKDTPDYHPHLASQTFWLGEVKYVIGEKQPYKDLVRCYRQQQTVIRIVRLPLIFVMEQLAEHIDVGKC